MALQDIHKTRSFSNYISWSNTQIYFSKCNFQTFFQFESTKLISCVNTGFCFLISWTYSNYPSNQQTFWNSYFKVINKSVICTKRGVLFKKRFGKRQWENCPKNTIMQISTQREITLALGHIAHGELHQKFVDRN